MSRPVISDREFELFRHFIFERAGITLSAPKKALVGSRLAKRLAHYGLGSYGDYFNLLGSGAAGEETQLAIDLLTTNETYFFREADHFELLRKLAEAADARGQGLRVWSAACSSGEEVYSIAMTLADTLGEQGPWEVLGSDISLSVLAKAQRGHYPIERARLVPKSLLHRYCLKGTGPHEGTLLVSKSLRQRVQFTQVNLSASLPHMGQFDLVFLRNVMIYFSKETKRKVIARIVSTLRPNGLLVIGHSESLHDIAGDLEVVAPSIYRKPGSRP